MICLQGRRPAARRARLPESHDDGVGQTHKKQSDSIRYQTTKNCPKDNETYADTVVPERNIVLLPLEADMDLLGSRDELVEIVDDSVGFSFGDADNVCHKARVEEYRFPPCDWVRADQWMLRDNWLSTDGTP